MPKGKNIVHYIYNKLDIRGPEIVIMETLIEIF